MIDKIRFDSPYPYGILEDRDKQILELKKKFEWHEAKRRETQDVLSQVKGEMKEVRDIIDNLRSQKKNIWSY
jgi:chromosome segregation ATPase